MAQLADNHALLLFRVGPVLCCAPTRCVTTLISSPSLTHPPGSSGSHPGIFRHDGQLVSLIDLRHLFGVEEPDRKQPGRIIICHLADQARGFLVDEVIDVISIPERGWGQLSPSLSGGVFRRSLLLDEKIHLYCEFEKLHMIRHAGFLKPWIQSLHEKPRPREDTPVHAAASATVLEKTSLPAKRAIKSSTISPPSATPSPAIAGFCSRPSARPVKQHPFNIHNNKADKITSTCKQATTNSTPQTDSQKRQTAAPVKLRDSASPVRHTPETSFPRQPPHPAHHDVRMRVDKPVTNLQIMTVVLICVGLISAIVYRWPNHATHPVIVKSATDRLTVEALTAANPRSPHPENTFSPITKRALNDEPDEASATAAHEDQDNSGTRYQASIEQRHHEVTIILTAPASETVIRSDNDGPVAHKPTSETDSAIERTPTPVSSRRPPHQHIDQVVHIVVRGDTLWHIARRYIHNPFRYPELARLNKIRNPDLIYPGDRVRIIRIYPQEPAAASTH